MKCFKYLPDINFHFKYGLSWLQGGGGKFLSIFILRYINNSNSDYMLPTHGNEYYPVNHDWKTFPLISDITHKNFRTTSEWCEKFTTNKDLELQNYYDTNNQWIGEFKDRLNTLKNYGQNAILSSHYPLAAVLLHTNITVDKYIHISNDKSWYPTLLVQLKELLGSGSAHIVPFFYGYKEAYDNISEYVKQLRELVSKYPNLSDLIFSGDLGFEKIDHLEHDNEIQVDIGLENTTLFGAYYMVWMHKTDNCKINIDTFKEYTTQFFNEILITKKLEGNQVRPGLNPLRHRLLYNNSQKQQPISKQKQQEWEIETFYNVKQKAIDLLNNDVMVIPYDRIFFDLQFPIKNTKKSIAEYSIKNLDIIDTFIEFHMDDKYKQNVKEKNDLFRKRIKQSL